MTTLDDLSMDQLQALYAQKTDPNVAAIHSIESGGASATSNPVNPASGASGSMQTMPKTAAKPGYGVKPSDGSNIDNTRTGVEYYQTMLKQYGDPVKAAVAYNWGPGHADKWIAAGSKLDDLPLETLQYVQKFDQKTGAISNKTAPAAQEAPAPAAATPPAATAPTAAQAAQPQSLSAQFLRQLGLTARAAGHGVAAGAGALTQGFTRLMGVPDVRDVINRGVDAITPAPQGGLEQGVQDVGEQVSNPLNYVVPGGGITRTALAGAAAAGMQPTQQGQTVMDTVKAMATGGIAGGALGAFGRVLAPETSPAIQRLRAEGIQPSVGQMGGALPERVEAYSTSVPLTGPKIEQMRQVADTQLNQAVYARALADVPNTVVPDQVGRAGIRSVKQQLQASYNDILPQMQFTPDQQFIVDFAPGARLANELPPAMHKQLSDILDNTLMHRVANGNGTLDGNALKESQSMMSRQIKELSGPNATVDESKIGQVLVSMRDAFEKGLIRQNPQQAPTLTAINRGWNIYSKMRQAGSTMKDPDAPFTPLAFQNAVKFADKSQGRDAFATGQANMQQLADDAMQVIGRRTPDSGTSGRSALLGLLGGGAAATGHLPAVLASMAGQAAYASPLGQATGRALLAVRPGIVRSIGETSPQAAGILGGAASSLLNRGQDSTR